MRVEVKQRETVKGGEQIKVKNAVHGRGKTACEEESLIAGKKKCGNFVNGKIFNFSYFSYSSQNSQDFLNKLFILDSYLVLSNRLYLLS